MTHLGGEEKDDDGGGGGIGRERANMARTAFILINPRKKSRTNILNCWRLNLRIERNRQEIGGDSSPSHSLKCASHR